MTLNWLTLKPIAHRGLHDFNKQIFENTLPAFELAAISGYPISCDVQLSSDGTPIIFHDSSLKHLLGTHERIIDLKAAEITKIHTHNVSYAITPLATMLDAIKGKVPVIINLIGNEDLDAGFITTVTELLLKYNNESAIMSADIHLLRQMPISSQDIPHGIYAHGTHRKDIEQHFAMLAHNIAFVAYNHNELQNPFVRFAKQKLNIPVLAATIQSFNEWEKIKPFAHQSFFEGFDFDKEQKLNLSQKRKVTHNDII